MSNIRLIILAVVMLMLLPGILLADTESSSFSGVGVLFNGVILLVIIICFLVAMKVFGLLRGGELASGWQILTVSFIVLCLGQLLELVSMLELFSLDLAIVTAFRLVGVTLLMLGLTKIKKVLS